MDLHALGLVQACRALAARRIPRPDYAGALHDRARTLDYGIQAFRSLAPAPGAFGLEPFGTGPLSGIPVAVKDLIDTADLPTAYGSPIHADHVPDCDAWIVSRLKDCGAWVLGKTVTTEFAWSHPGPTRNPWNRAHTPGGSSSGSAAAVAAGFAPLGLGTQTFGSVIRPAAFCGVVGLKPSFGAIPRTGVHPLSGSLDHVGLFTRCVADAAFALSLVLGQDDGDPGSRRSPPFGFDLEAGLASLSPPRLALVRTSAWREADPEQRDLVEAAAWRFASAGAAIEEVVLPDAFEGAGAAARTILAAEAQVVLASVAASHPTLVSSALAELVAEGAAVTAASYIGALDLQRTLRQNFAAAIGPADAILTLPAAGAAPKGLGHTGDPRFCVAWTFIGGPALSLPAGETSDGLPLGLQLVGAYRQDKRLLRAGAWCEGALDRPVRFPRLSAVEDA